MSESRALRSVPAEDAAHAFGRRLRRRRSVKGLSLQEVASRSGISVGQLSGIERGLYPPTLETLRKLCDALDMPRAWLFDPPPGPEGEDGVVVRAGGRRELALPANGILKEMLTPDEAGNIQMLRLVIEPGGGWEGPFSTLRRTISARCGLVLKGRLALTLDDERYTLGPGDSFGTDAKRRIAFRCEGTSPCEVIWVTTPAVY